MSGTEASKRPLKYVEIAVSNFKEVAVPHFQKLLHDHKDAIQQLQGDPSKMHTEHASIKRAESQLKSLLYELDTLRAQVQDSDLDKFDMKTVSLRKTILQIMSEYKDMLKQPLKSPGPIPHTEDESDESHLICNETKQLHITADLDEIKLDEKQGCLRSVELIQNDIHDLHSAFGDLHQMVHEQAEDVNKIENNVEDAHVNVEVGSRHIVTAARYNASIYPVAGAVMGGCLGGPLGLIAGLKFGGIAALCCGCLGYVGGRLIKKQKFSDIPESTSDLHENQEEPQSCLSEGKENKKDE